ncbi:hypothetical protein N499_0373A, partial [Wolbachia pipientis wVitA]
MKVADTGMALLH